MTGPFLYEDDFVFTDALARADSIALLGRGRYWGTTDALETAGFSQIQPQRQRWEYLRVGLYRAGQNLIGGVLFAILLPTRNMGLVEMWKCVGGGHTAGWEPVELYGPTWCENGLGIFVPQQGSANPATLHGPDTIKAEDVMRVVGCYYAD